VDVFEKEMQADNEEIAELSQEEQKVRLGLYLTLTPTLTPTLTQP